MHTSMEYRGQIAIDTVKVSEIRQNRAPVFVKNDKNFIHDNLNELNLPPLRNNSFAQTPQEATNISQPRTIEKKIKDVSLSDDKNLSILSQNDDKITLHNNLFNESFKILNGTVLQSHRKKHTPQLSQQRMHTPLCNHAIITKEDDNLICSFRIGNETEVFDQSRICSSQLTQHEAHGLLIPRDSFNALAIDNDNTLVGSCGFASGHHSWAIQGTGIFCAVRCAARARDVDLEI